MRGKSDNTLLLELVVRPPISVNYDCVIQQLEHFENYLSIAVPEPEVE